MAPASWSWPMMWVIAFMLTFVEAILALTFVRLVYRLLKQLFVLVSGRQPATA